MFDEQYYISKLKEISEREFISFYQMHKMIGVSHRCMYANILKGKPLHLSTKKKIKQFIDKYEVENGRERQ